MAVTGSGIVHFGAQNPTHPWWYVADRIVQALVGYEDQILPGIRFAVVTPRDLQGALNNPIDVAAGTLALGITTPSVSARMAVNGIGAYGEPHPGLKAIAAYPHIDYLIFAVDAATGITSLEQLERERYPLRLVSGRRSDRGIDVLTFTVEEVLKQYGISYASIEEWGGQVFFPGPSHIGGRLVLDGTADAMFQEAEMLPIWGEIDTPPRRVNYLPVSEAVRDHMLQTYGFAKREIPAGRWPGVTAPVPTVDFSGWLVFCRDDLPEEWAYAVAKACDHARDAVDNGPHNVTRCLALPLEGSYMFNETAIPLHDGARRYAEEQGYLS
jgi:TRAP-type uncharacterized transport system substrate-binding protein